MNKYSDRFASEKKKSHYSQILNPLVFKDYISEKQLVSDRSKIVSKCTFRQKEIMRTVHRLESAPSMESIQSVYSSPYLKKERDFEKLISQLDAVIFSNSSQKTVVLDEDNPYHSILYEGCTQHYRIDVFGKRCPLQVNLHRERGIFKVVYAKNKSDPTEFSCDGCIKKDAVRISDNSLKFKTEFVGISVTAQTDSKFLISVKFGSRKAMPWMSESNWNYMSTPRSQAPKSERSEYYKNFVELNMNPVPLNSPMGLHLVKFKDWKSRRDQVVVKKRNNLQEKRNKTILLLNRNAMIKEEQNKQKLEMETAKINREKQQTWLKFLYLAKMIETARRVVKEEKEKLVVIMRRQRSVKKIQTMFKKTVNGMSPRAFNICKSWNLLAMFTHPYKLLVVNSLWKQMAKYIIVNKTVTQPRNKVQALLKKVVAIQKAWQNYYHVDRQRLNLLSGIWNKVFLEIEKNRIFKNTKYDDIVEIAFLTKKQRIVVLKEYLKQKKLEYLQRIKEHFEGGLYDSQPKPDFKYIPTEAEMKDIMYNAAQNI